MGTETLATGTEQTASTGATGETTQTQTGTGTQQTGTGTQQQQQEQQTAEQKAEADKATAAKAEEDRRAALTDEQRKAEDDAKAAAEAKRKEQFGAPEKYEFTPPKDSKPLKPELVEKLQAFAKERDLSQASAQALYDLGNETVQAVLGEVAAQIELTKNDWAVRAKADKEFGGDQIDANLAVARKAMELGTPELKTLLNDTGLGDHPEIIRWMYRVGKTIKQDEHVSGERRTTTERSAQAFYPNSNMNP
jgi:hypothetical protein